MTRRAWTAPGIAMLLAAACGSGPAPEERPVDAPTLAELAGATYRGVVDRPVTLQDGRWAGEPFVEGGASRPMVGLVGGGVFEGDVDGDGADEAAVLLWSDTGGSGSPVSLALMDRREDGIENLATVFVGDRVQVMAGSIAGGRVVLDLVEAGPDDALCCPTQKARVTWELSDGGLIEIARENTGTLSVADLEGPVWVLVEPGDVAPPEGNEIDLVFADGRVSGSAGCNTYFAAVVESVPGGLGFNGMGTTRMACPDRDMEAERRYLKTLAGAEAFGFRAGRLVVSCTTDDGPATLVFAPRSAGR